MRLLRGSLLLMCFLFILSFLLFAAAEVWLMVLAAGRYGVFNTMLFLILGVIVGASYAKRQGIDSMRRMQADMSRGINPSESITDSLMVVLGGGLLALPGFLSDAVGITMLIPATRRLWKRGMASWLATKVKRPEPPKDPRIIDV